MLYSDDGRLFIWDKENGQLLNMLTADEEVVNQMTVCQLEGYIVLSIELKRCKS